MAKAVKTDVNDLVELLVGVYLICTQVLSLYSLVARQVTQSYVAVINQLLLRTFSSWWADSSTAT